MTKIIICLVLVISIGKQLHAQESQSDRVFDIPPDHVFMRSFSIRLDPSNKIKIEVSDVRDIDRLLNLDSLIGIYLDDIILLKDSLSNITANKRIDYITDTLNRKKIRIIQYPQKGTSFLVEGSELAILKTEQDTINIIGILKDPPKAHEKISRHRPRYFRITILINDQSNLETFVDGRLNQKMRTFLDNHTGKWKGGKGSPYYIPRDPSITSLLPRAHTGGTGDYLAFMFYANIQNYKNYFVPSVSLGTHLVLSNRDRNYKHDIGVSWEPLFFFNRDASGKLKTYRNDFLTLFYGAGPVKDKDLKKETSFLSVVSFGYLIHSTGDFMEKNSFRFGAGRFTMNKTSLEPCIYFNNFFKGVSPAVRLIQRF